MPSASTIRQFARKSQIDSFNKDLENTEDGIFLKK